MKNFNVKNLNNETIIKSLIILRMLNKNVSRIFVIDVKNVLIKSLNVEDFDKEILNKIILIINTNKRIVIARFISIKIILIIIFFDLLRKY